MATSLVEAASAAMRNAPGTSSPSKEPRYALYDHVSVGLGEPIRWMFYLFDIPFEDFLIWPEGFITPQPPIRPASISLTLMPILEINGKPLTQSFATLRYFAKKLRFVADEPETATLGEELIEAIKECRLLSRDWMKKKIKITVDEKEVENIDKNLNDIFTPYLGLMTSMVEEIPGDYLHGDLMTYPDLILANWLDIWNICLGPDILEPYPVLRTHLWRILFHPKISAKRMIRAKSMFNFDSYSVKSNGEFQNNPAD